MIDPDRILRDVSRPARYTGGEWNSIKKDWNSADIRMVLAYPDAYEIGMSNMGLAILYDILNQRPDILAERAYTPWTDMAAGLRKARIPLFSLESKKPLAEFDIIGFSLGYELTFTNVLEMLDLAGIPILATERSDAHPLVVAGGTCALNPEPMSDFIDAFVIGEGEEVMVELVDCFNQWKKEVSDKKDELLRQLSQIEGVYVPKLYPDEKPAVTRRIVSVLPPPPTRPIVASMEIVHDRGAVEIQRGCTRGCRFCQASIAYRPVRERSVEEVVEAADEIVTNCGYEEISLLSLSTSDYSGIAELVPALSERFRGMQVNLSLPSLRPDSFSIELARSIQGQRKASLTFAPEAGTDRLRNVINKNTSEAALLETIELALNQGWNSFKLYFMIGLPTETPEDVKGIVDLVRKARQIKSQNGKRPNIKVSVSSFIPKPHTPFQWATQSPEEELMAKHQILRDGIKKTGASLSWHDTRVSLLEGMMSRGDRKLGPAIARAWQLGCVFDAWSDLFAFDKWMQAFAECGINPADYVRGRKLDEALPWDYIQTGVSSEFLKNEYRRALNTQPTPDCRREKCNGCGLQKLNTNCKNKAES